MWGLRKRKRKNRKRKKTKLMRCLIQTAKTVGTMVLILKLIQKKPLLNKPRVMIGDKNGDKKIERKIR